MWGRRAIAPRKCTRAPLRHLWVNTCTVRNMEHESLLVPPPRSYLAELPHTLEACAARVHSLASCQSSAILSLCCFETQHGTFALAKSIQTLHFLTLHFFAASIVFLRSPSNDYICTVLFPHQYFHILAIDASPNVPAIWFSFNGHHARKTYLKPKKLF